MGTSKTTPPILPKKILEGIPEGLPSEEVERLQQLQSKLADFILHLIQAFLRTGYYTAEHPESKKAKEGLFQQFKNLFGDEDEFTLLVREEQEKKEILVEGLLPESQRLSRMMMKGMGELYVPKFANYLERKDLTSLTLKSQMSQTEFTHFVDIMSEPSLIDTRGKQDKDRFAQALDSRGIFNISYVFNDELVVSEREMPWRARMTISRMKKDLKMIPLFQKMVGQELQVIRKKLIQDALRPVRQSEILYAILCNSDLAVPTESWGVVVEDEIVSILQKQYLLGISKIFLREHIALKSLKKQGDSPVKTNRIVLKIARRLKETGTKETENLLEEFFRNELVSLDDLTSELKDKIVLERLTDKFLKYTEQFFQRLDQAKEKKAFLAVAHSFVGMIPELIRRDRYSEILHILETLNRHFHQKSMWALLAGQVLEEIGTGSIPVMLEEKFFTGKKEVRTLIIPIFISLELGSISSLLNILKKSEDQWVRKNACEALVQIGPVAATHLLKELDQQQTSVETTCDILRVIGEIKSQEWKVPLMKVLMRYATHEHPKLREQALHTFYQIGGTEGEEIFLSSLNDVVLDVQKKAVWCLGMIKSIEGVEKMIEILNQISPTPSPQTDKLETQIYYAMGMAGNLIIEGKKIEEILLGVLEKRGTKRWWDPFQKNLLTETALMAIFDALGKIGTEESRKILTKLEKSYKGPWTPKVRDALKKIEDRTALPKD